MSGTPKVIGIDIGSVAIGVSVMNLNIEVIKTAYEFHHGRIEDTLKRLLTTLELSGPCAIACTSSSPPVFKTHGRYDNRVAVIAAAQHYHQKIGSILLVGGEKFGLIRFDDDGNYLKFQPNTSCAAGTGSFLDQQALRLNLSGIEELSRIAFANDGAIPKIASRCAVFAKTDLVHAQQEGYTLAEICDGLCYGLAKNIADTLFGGQTCREPVIFTGGVSRNKAVVKHLVSITGK